MKYSLISACVMATISLTTAATAKPHCGINRDVGATTKTTLVVTYDVSQCPTLSDPAGAKARICLEKEGTGSWVCNALQRSNAPTVGTNTGTMRFIGLSAGSKYRAVGWYAKKEGKEIIWRMTNSVILRTKK